MTFVYLYIHSLHRLFSVCTEPIKRAWDIIRTRMTTRIQRCSVCGFCAIQTSIHALLTTDKFPPLLYETCIPFVPICGYNFFHSHFTACPQNPHQCGYTSLFNLSPQCGQSPILVLKISPQISTGIGSCFVSNSSAISCAHGSTSVAVFMWSMSDCTDTLYFFISSLSFSENCTGRELNPPTTGFPHAQGGELFTSFLFFPVRSALSVLAVRIVIPSCASRTVVFHHNARRGTRTSAQATPVVPA